MSGTRRNRHIRLKLKHMREFYGARTLMVAKFAGVSVDAYMSWEKEETYPSIEQLYLISRFYDVSMESLIEYDQNKE